MHLRHRPMRSNCPHCYLGLLSWRTRVWGQRDLQNELFSSPALHYLAWSLSVVPPSAFLIVFQMMTKVQRVVVVLCVGVKLERLYSNSSFPIWSKKHVYMTLLLSYWFPMQLKYRLCRATGACPCNYARAQKASELAFSWYHCFPFLNQLPLCWNLK